MYKIFLWLKETSQPLLYHDVINTYTKGEFFVIYYLLHKEEAYDKFPISNIWRVREFKEEMK
jgi:hypothetical protein